LNGLDQQLKAFCAEFGEIQEHTCDIAAWARKDCDKAAGHRIGFKVERDHGNARSRTAFETPAFPKRS
jgi:hypothetical protein